MRISESSRLLFERARSKIPAEDFAALSNPTRSSDTRPTDTRSTATRPTATRSTPSLFFALFLAFIGGMILNLMPCVLPVLSIKILGFIHSSQDQRPWVQGWVYAAGVLISFWILAGTLLLLRAGGEQLGWGFQLQSPIFVGTLCVIFFVLGLNMMGIFEIGESFTRLSVPDGKSVLVQSFLSGVLATLVATPCTAPFMGSALGFAITQPPLVAFLIFTAIGLGMALPYVLLTYFVS